MNGLESYAYNLRNSLTDEKLAEKFDAADKSKLEGAVNDTIKWLDASQEGSKEEYEEKQKELQVEAIAKYGLFFFDLNLLLTGLSLALSCKNSMALRVVHRVVLEDSPAVLQVDSLALLVASLVVLLAISLVDKRKVPAWRSTRFVFSLSLHGIFCPPHNHLTSRVEK
jgi:hypothetical protein